MNTIEIWYLLIGGNISPVIPLTYVDLEETNTLSELTKKIKEENSNILKNIDASQLTVLRCKDRKMEFDGKMSDILKDQVGRLFADRANNLEQIDMWETVGGLKLLNNEALVVQMPSALPPSSHNAGDIIPPIVVKSGQLGEFDEFDLYKNDIRQYSPSRSLPSFVAAYRNKLNAKRLVKDEDFATLENMFGTALCNQYFDHASTTMPRSDISLEYEARCMMDLHLDSTSNYLLSIGAEDYFVTYCFFFKLINYFYQLKVNRLSYKLKAPWPFPLVVRHRCSHYRHTPENNFSLWCQAIFPRLLANINSKEAKPGQICPVDCCALLLEGANIVKYVNQGRKQAGKPLDYVLMVIYIKEPGNATRHLLFQLEDSDEVYYTEACDSLTGIEGRLTFAQELFNLGDILISEADTEYFGDSKEVGDFMDQLMSRAGSIPTFRSNPESDTDEDLPNKRQRSDESEDLPNKRQRSDESDIDEDLPIERQRQQDEEEDDLEEAGYESTSILPRVQVFSYGTFEPLCPIPPLVYSIRRIGDKGGDEYIAKRLKKYSSELEILRMLDKKEARCDNIIQLVDTIHSRSITFIVLSKQIPLYGELESTGSRAFIVLSKQIPLYGELESTGSRALDGRFIDLSRDLARGVTFLHDNCIAHLDIKPANLVYTTSYRLQIIDFDVAVQVDSEESQIARFIGTNGWMAPEIGTKDGIRRMYSPIKADRYSCGLVFMKFVARHTGDDEGLAKFANRLLSRDPNSRPQLAEWCSPQAGVADDDDEMMHS